MLKKKKTILSKNAVFSCFEVNECYGVVILKKKIYFFKYNEYSPNIQNFSNRWRREIERRAQPA